jgi:lipoyl(octanoyl) transferase
LGAIRKDVVWYVRMLEEVMIRATAEFEITAERVAGKTGIWVRGTGDSNVTGVFEEKLGAIGVHISRWVTSHGFAYNVSTDLRYFDLIVPCGISGCKATSLEKILERAVTRQEAVQPVVRNFGEVFGLEMREASRDDLLAQLHAQQQLSGEPDLGRSQAVEIAS